MACLAAVVAPISTTLLDIAAHPACAICVRHFSSVPIPIFALPCFTHLRRELVRQLCLSTASEIHIHMWFRRSHDSCSNSLQSGIPTEFSCRSYREPGWRDTAPGHGWTVGSRPLGALDSRTPRSHGDDQQAKNHAKVASAPEEGELAASGKAFLGLTPCPPLERIRGVDLCEPTLIDLRRMSTARMVASFTSSGLYIEAVPSTSWKMSLSTAWQVLQSFVFGGIYRYQEPR